MHHHVLCYGFLSKKNKESLFPLAVYSRTHFITAMTWVALDNSAPAERSFNENIRSCLDVFQTNDVPVC